MLGYKFDTFEGFATADHAAFEEHKWASNRFNLERMKARAKMDALANAIASELGEAKGELAFRTTLDHPHIFNRNQVRHCWAYLDRADDTRAELTRLVDRELALKTKVEDDIPQHHFAIVGVGIDARGVEVFLRLHANASLDRRNLLARLSDPLEVPQFHALMSNLPETAEVAVGADSGGLPASVDDTATLVKSLERFTDWFTITVRYGIQDPALDPETFPGIAASTVKSLLKVRNFAAWSKENDRLKLARAMKEEKKQKAKKKTGLEAGDTVYVTSGLLGGKTGKVMDIDHKGRVKVQLGRVTIDMDPKLLRKQ
jgi:hypothetical protein